MRWHLLNSPAAAATQGRDHSHISFVRKASSPSPILGNFGFPVLFGITGTKHSLGTADKAHTQGARDKEEVQLNPPVCWCKDKPAHLRRERSLECLMDMEKRGKQESVCRWKQAEDVGYEKGRSNGESQ